MVEHAVIVGGGQRLNKVLPQSPVSSPDGRPDGQRKLPPSEQITHTYIHEQQEALERAAILKVLDATHWRIRGR